MLQSAAFEQTLLNYVRILPIEQQQAVLDFAAFLHQQQSVQYQYGVEGNCLDLDIDLTQEDIAILRTELSSGLLRELVL